MPHVHRSLLLRRFPGFVALTICSPCVRTTHIMERKNTMGARCKVIGTHGLREMTYRKKWDFATRYDWCRRKAKVAIVVTGGVGPPLGRVVEA